jgi:MFS family permease
MSAESSPKERRPNAPADQDAARGGGRSRIRDHLVGIHTRSRRVISEHRHKRKLQEREVSDRSRRGLDWTNFFLADVQMSFGSFLAFYLADFGWSKQNVGLALTVGGLAAVAAQIPGGALADAVRWKRGLAACGFILIATAALILALRPSFSLVFVAETLHGMSAGLVGPAIAAISLGLAGRHGMSSRIGRNYRFAGAGNAVTAAFMGALGAYLSNHAIFMAAAVLCIPALIALNEIRPKEIDYIRARNAAKRDHTLDLQRLIDFMKNWRLVLFAGAPRAVPSLQCLVAASGQRESGAQQRSQQRFIHGWTDRRPPGGGGNPGAVDRLLVRAMGPQAAVAGRLWHRSGARAAVRVRFRPGTHAGRASARRSDRRGCDCLDDSGHHLTTGTGRFNLAQGVLGTIRGIAAAIGTGSIGFIVQHFGDFTGYLLMAIGPAAAAALIWAFLPETKLEKYID